jgi:hypothetical protein
MIVSTLLLVSLFNLAAGWYLSIWSPNIGYLLMAAKWNMLYNLPDPVHLLILGDSSGNQGVDPGIIKSETGMTAVNLCTIGDALALNSAWMIDAYIERYGVPKQILIVQAYDVWPRDINIGVLAQVPGSWRDREPKMRLGLKQRIRLFLNSYVPIYAQSISLGYVLQNPWKAFRRELTLEPDGFMREESADSQYVVQDTRFHREFVRQQNQVLSESNRAALQRIVALAEQYQFDVFIANGPIYDRLYADSAFQAYFERLQAAIAPIVAASPRVHYILNPPMTFPASKMQSVDHLTYTGALEYTSRIVSEMRIASVGSH